jgi:hypothetical protein
MLHLSISDLPQSLSLSGDSMLGKLGGDGNPSYEFEQPVQEKRNEGDGRSWFCVYNLEKVIHSSSAYSFDTQRPLIEMQSTLKIPPTLRKNPRDRISIMVAQDSATLIGHLLVAVSAL